jgi:hypothetical protein
MFRTVTADDDIMMKNVLAGVVQSSSGGCPEKGGLP